MQPTPPSEDANEEFRRDLGGTRRESPEAERAEAQRHAHPVELDEPRRRGWRFWRRRVS
jgi:hypothetical protein